MRKRLLAPGDVVAGKYSVKALLGEGGMGAVYFVRHAVTGKRLALKMLHATSRKTTEAEKRLIREAIATGQIEHRNVVDVFDLDEHEGSVFLVMEYLDGKTLKQLFADQTLSDGDFLELMIRAMEGVRAAHKIGIIHRDLKPDNIYVCYGPSGKLDDPRILDFGVCRLTMHSELTELTKAGLTLGSPYYMSLEQFEGARDIDQRADVYSLGVILYQGFSGRRPFEARSLAELTSKIASGQPPQHLREHRPDLPKGLCNVVMRAMARTRNKRHDDVAALIRDLAPYVERLVTRREPVSSSHSNSARPPRSLRPSTRPSGRSGQGEPSAPISIWAAPRTRSILQVLGAGLLAFVLTLSGIHIAQLVSPSRAKGPVVSSEPLSKKGKPQAIEPLPASKASTATYPVQAPAVPQVPAQALPPTAREEQAPGSEGVTQVSKPSAETRDHQ